MDPLASAALASWTPQPAVLAFLLLIGFLYWRGWRHGRELVRTDQDSTRLLAFLGGLTVLAIALQSPLDALDGLFLSAHMVQHLLLLMVAPPLLLLGRPMIPLLRGLPKRFVREGLGPFLSYKPLHRLGEFVTALPFTWFVFALFTLVWHLPIFYEHALASPVWHGAQHACFFWSGVLFWWPIIQQSPAKRRWPEWAAIPYLLFSDIVNTALSAFLIFSGRVLYPSYARVQMPGFSPVDDQALAGAIMWVPGSLIYLIPAITFTVRIFSSNQQARKSASSSVRVDRAEMVRRKEARQVWWTRRLPTVRRGAQVLMLLLAAFVVFSGFRGPQVAPVNPAGTLPWIYWRALAVVALLTVGNLFCMVCPFVLLRDWTRRLLPKSVAMRFRWPRPLRNKWVPIGLTLLYLWAYEAFGLWNSPLATAYIVVGYFAAAVAIDSFFRGATFCKYVCPIGQFHFVTSLVSPREVRVKQPKTCESCQTFDCIKGNAQTRGCELDLFQPKKASNLDCTFCLDCVKACPHDNVALLPVLPAETVLKNDYRSSLGRLAKRNDYAALALLITFGAFANAAGMINPVMMFEHRMHARLGVHGMPIAVGVFTLLAAVVTPLLMVGACALANALLKPGKPIWDSVRQFVFALVPVGAGMWAAHLLYHLVTVAAQGGMPSWLTPAQIVLMNAGVLLSLYLTWRLSSQVVNQGRSAAAVWAPWGLMAVALYVCGIWILLQPMQMRGMMHS